MAKNYGNYQYETSPRKIKPDYIPHKKKVTKKNVNKNKNDLKQNNKTNKLDKRAKVKAISIVAILFSILLVISYRNSQITEKFSQVKNLKNDLASIEKENEQLEVSIESSINLGTIENEAQEQLGMKKLDNNQKIYVSLPKKDYIEPAAESIVKTDNDNWFKKILNIFLGK